MTDRGFQSYDEITAPPAARAIIRSTTEHFGFLPTPMTRLAESPETMRGFTHLNGLFESSTLDPLAREVLVMTVATRNGCHYCVALHTAGLERSGVDPATITALRNGAPLDDPRLEAMRTFTIAVMERTGAVEPGELEAFLAAGYDRRNALEVVLGIATYTLSTYANRMTGAELDPPLQPYAWDNQPATL